MKSTRMAGLALLAAISPAWADDAAQESRPAALQKEEARIPFINLRSTILSWQANGQEGIWIQDQRKQWYYAQTYGVCQGLEFTAQLGFKTGTLNTLDKFSQIVVPGYGRCAIRSLTNSAAPPDGKRHEAVSEEK